MIYFDTVEKFARGLFCRRFDWHRSYLQ